MVEEEEEVVDAMDLLLQTATVSAEHDLADVDETTAT